MNPAQSTPSAELRVVSLLPSATEMVCLVGGEPNLVGISHECDYPQSIQDRTVITSSKVSFSPSSLKIDQDVRKLMTHALAVYDIDTDGLEALHPDFIVTQDLCDVCAVSYADVERACAQRLPGTTIVNLHPTRWSEVMDDVQAVASALGVPERGVHEVAKLEARRQAITDRSEKLATRPNVLTIEWLDPVMVGGTWMPELVHAAGGFALVTEAGQHAPTLTKEQLKALDPAPDVVLVKPCGFPLKRTFEEPDVLRSIFEGLDWPAVHAGAIWVADGNAFFNRPGPRLADSIEILAACIHPQEFGDMAQKHAQEFVRYEA
ncbi:MAG: iron complex transport system substrate-binding protein [Candidatus Paceibacteria bacterium]|jgi:iron complex transport system substrate-binding protein